jgi:predicted nuclease of predicted toxin-antitoxin system
MSTGLLTNENFPFPALRKLRAAGVDVVSVTEIMPAASDDQVMEYARKERRWIVTFDRDYGEFVFKKGWHRHRPSFIYAKSLTLRNNQLKLFSQYSPNLLWRKVTCWS